MLKRVRRIAGRVIVNEAKMGKKKKINRKNFFGNVGMGLLFIGLMKNLPFKFLNNIKRNSKKIKVTIHPSAIKRNK